MQTVSDRHHEWYERCADRDPPADMRGMLGTERQAEHSADLWNYFYRGIIACCLSAKAFGDEELFVSIRKFEAEFLRETGSDYQSNEWLQI